MIWQECDHPGRTICQLGGSPLGGAGVCTTEPPPDLPVDVPPPELDALAAQTGAGERPADRYYGDADGARMGGRVTAAHSLVGLASTFCEPTQEWVPES
ncbi:hypothetical protein GCM10010218_06180 [Streptomyces mashuensis]|uniref:Uncharacterized protein n=1 Tax=Streptomyces mashuensis TaxID=33904 RepID=A0A919AVQ2_9ACTN|nr:hypothetical protein GCM10010218_06180 [Streptomyces mashuensis]